MFRRLVLALAVIGGAVGAGCYDTPKPKCAFLCGAGGECPTDYQCGGDNRCHLVENGVLATCTDSLPLDGAVADAPEPDSPPGTPDAPPAPDAPPGTPDATPMPDAPPPPPIDAGVPDAAPPIDAGVPDAVIPDADIDATI